MREAVRLLFIVFIVAASVAHAENAQDDLGKKLRGETFSIHLGEQIYALAMKEKAADLSPAAVQAAEAFLASQQRFPQIDIRILDVAHALGRVIAEKNADKLTAVDLLIHQEFLPFLFRSYSVFKALYGVALARNLEPAEIEQIGSFMAHPTEGALAQKLKDAHVKFGQAAIVYASIAFGQMQLQDAEFDLYGLNLTGVNFAFQKAKPGN